MALLKFCILAAMIGSIYGQRERFFVKKAPLSGRRTILRRPEAVPSEEYAPTKQCPLGNGFFPDTEQCDKYIACIGGVGTERLCPDGFVFNDYDSHEEKCDLPLNIDCSKRPKLQTPQPSEHCPRKNGYFGHEKKGVCDKFYFCVDGQFNMITCPAGLVFSPKTGICTWPDEVGISGCESGDLFDFDCPKVNETEAKTHPVYADPADCQYYYVCVNGEIPRRNGCRLGQVFDETSKQCTSVANVPECADWYKGQLTDGELMKLDEKAKKEFIKENRGGGGK